MKVPLNVREMKLDYRSLVSLQRRSFRNGGWYRLPLVDRALFRCALWVARVRGRILNLKLLVRVLGIVLRLLDTPRMCIWRAGRARAEELTQRFEDRGLFQWAPRVRGWLADRSYVFCLGLEVSCNG